MTYCTCQQQVRRSTVQFTTPTTTHRCFSDAIFITARSMYDCDEDRTTEECILSGKSEAELALDVLYY